MQPQNQTQKPKRIARTDQLKRSPIPWIVLLIFATAIFFIFAKDNLKIWQTTKKEVADFKQENPEIESRITNLIIERDQKEIEFEKIAKPQREIERQILPQYIDPQKIVRILEIFSLQMLNIIEEGSESIFELTNLTIGKPSKDNATPKLLRTNVQINIITNQKNLETFIRFLQTNEIPPQLKNARESGVMIEEDLIDYKILETQKLPIMIIETLTKSPYTTKDNINAFKVNLSIFFYHQNTAEARDPVTTNPES